MEKERVGGEEPKMQKISIKRRFPKTTVLLVVILLFVIVIFLGYVYKPLGAFLLGSVAIITSSAVNFAFWLVGSIQLWVGLGIVGLVAVLIVYRRKYGKKTGYAIPVAGQSLQGGLLNTQPFQPVNTGTVVAQEKKDEVVVSG